MATSIYSVFGRVASSDYPGQNNSNDVTIKTNWLGEGNFESVVMLSGDTSDGMTRSYSSDYLGKDNTGDFFVSKFHSEDFVRVQYSYHVSPSSIEINGKKYSLDSEDATEKAQELRELLIADGIAAFTVNTPNIIGMPISVFSDYISTYNLENRTTFSFLGDPTDHSTDLGNYVYTPHTYHLDPIDHSIASSTVIELLGIEYSIDGGTSEEKLLQLSKQLNADGIGTITGVHPDSGLPLLVLSASSLSDYFDAYETDNLLIYGNPLNPNDGNGRDAKFNGELNDVILSSNYLKPSIDYIRDVIPPTIYNVDTSWGSALVSSELDHDGTVTVTILGVENDQPVTVTLGGIDYIQNVTDNSVSITVPAVDLRQLVNETTYSLTLSISDAAGNVVTKDNLNSFEVNVINDVPTGSITISGTTTEGQVVTVNTSSLADADGLGTLSYQWLRDGADISGATSSTYTLAQADVGAAVAARVSYTDGSGTAESVSSVATQAIAAPSADVTPTQDVVGGLNIEQLSKDGDVVTYGLFADASYDPGGDGIGALDIKTISFDPTDLDYVEGSLTSDHFGQLFVANEQNASSGVVLGAGFGLSNFTDFEAPIAEFQMTVLDTSQPVSISITGTGFDGAAAPDTTETFDYTSSTLTATVITRDGTAMDGVTVTASDSSYTTDGAGQTSFEVSNGSDVVVNASLDFENVSPTNAINAMDALQALRIAVGLETSNGPATYHDYIASDFDASGSVNAMDALGILKYAVGLDAPDARWVFIDSDGDYSDV
ncbi:MAG: hypothetical protein HOI09_06735, partial [Porticoccaceae bacterium]|nr:hypothetical protein [Porticoccaceae bacterium]